jgi:hypothetical protein
MAEPAWKTKAEEPWTPDPEAPEDENELSVLQSG